MKIKGRELYVYIGTRRFSEYLCSTDVKFKIFDYESRPSDCTFIDSPYNACWNKKVTPSGSPIFDRTLNQFHDSMVGLYKKYGKPSRPEDVVSFRRKGLTIKPIYKRKKKVGSARS